jgi:hypothetical protein
MDTSGPRTSQSNGDAAVVSMYVPMYHTPLCDSDAEGYLHDAGSGWLNCKQTKRMGVSEWCLCVCVFVFVCLCVCVFVCVCVCVCVCV